MDEEIKAICLALTNYIYTYNAVGSNLHIVLDDGNFADENIQWCLNNSIKNNDHESSETDLHLEKSLAMLLLTIPENERDDATGNDS